MKLIIPLAERIADNFGHPLHELFKLMVSIGQVGKDEEILLDYSTAVFTHPFFTLPMLLLVKSQNNKKGFNIQITTNFKSPAIANYMESIAFPDMLTCDEKRIDEITQILDRYQHKTYLPLVNFPIGIDLHTINIRDKFINHLNNLIKSIVAMDDQPQLRNAIHYMIDELLSNIVHHAHEDKGYILVQNYPTKGYLDICIGDIGRTLLESYQHFNNNQFEIANHSQAMAAALSGKSTKGGIDRGYGISTSTRMLCEGMNGKFFMFSGNAFAYINSREKDISEINLPHVFWDGVLICMRIPHRIDPIFNYTNFLE